MNESVVSVPGSYFSICAGPLLLFPVLVEDVVTGAEQKHMPQQVLGCFEGDLEVLMLLGTRGDETHLTRVNHRLSKYKTEWIEIFCKIFFLQSTSNRSSPLSLIGFNGVTHILNLSVK